MMVSMQSSDDVEYCVLLMRVLCDQSSGMLGHLFSV